jgi:hypoxanthine phosphoribosyltransferase
VSFALSIVFGITTLGGVWLTIVYGRRAARLQAQLKTIEWTDVKLGAVDLAREVKAVFEPDLIFCASVRGGIIAFFLSEALHAPVPTFIGITEWHGMARFQDKLDDFDSIHTMKCNVHIPLALYTHRASKLLIIDDLALGGIR